MPEKTKKPGEKKSPDAVWQDLLKDQEQNRRNRLQDDPKWMDEWLKKNGGQKCTDKPDSKDSA